MSEAKHTPGPWCVQPVPDGGMTAVLQEGDGYESDDQSSWPNGGFDIAECFGPAQEANARLIAAAPEMLEALMAVEQYLPFDWAFDSIRQFVGQEDYREACAKVRAIIAKAIKGAA